MSLRDAKDAERRAWRLLQSCPPRERTWRAAVLREARAQLRKAEAMAALQPRATTETERRVAALEARRVA